MTPLNRSVAPTTSAISDISLPKAICEIGPSDIPVYWLNGSTEEILRLEFVFNAGISKQKQLLIASATNSLIQEGTLTRNAREIADGLDFYGSYLQTRCAVDDSQITLFCLKKHLNKCLGIVLDVLKNAQFPENEIDIYTKNSKQRLKVQQQKTSYLCRRAFYKEVFGEQSPISSFSESGDYDKISRETLLGFYSQHYQNSIKYITISGDVTREIISTVQEFGGNFTLDKSINSYHSTKGQTENRYIHKPKSVQATLRIGKKSFNRKHTDYRRFQLLNLVLGGYFGSRLMKNIREDKGLTYGIYSSLESYLDDGCFYIEADVNTHKVGIATAEIYKEIERLNNDLIPEKELHTAKNYFLGSLLRSIDGPFTIMDRNRLLLDYGLSENYYSELFTLIKETSSEDLRTTCNLYLNKNSLVEVVCGG
ncbi:MAG: insulinase family protein [Bacteroidetes bacterium]|nr:MAG: insulinase family protein [Bacteroidota bacterium]